MKWFRIAVAFGATVIFAGVAIAQGTLGIRDQLMNLKMVNYFPAHAAHVNVWMNWRPDEVDQDFAVIAGMHANAVRIVLYTQTTGFPKPAPVMVNRLKQFVNLADKHGLRTKLGLFGFFRNYSDIAGSTQWAEALLHDFKDDRRIAYIDLYNEIDVKNPEALRWAAQMLPHIRDVVGTIPLTVSCGASLSDVVTLRKALTAVAPTNSSTSLVDFFEIHYYAKAPAAYKVLTDIRDAVAPSPLYVGEFGCSTSPAERQSAHLPERLLGEPWWEANQDQVYRTVEYAARGAHLPPAAPWIFCDYAPNALPGVNPESRKPLFAMGFCRVDRSPKPAGLTLARFFESGAIDLGFNNGFEKADSSTLPLNWSIRSFAQAKFARDTAVKHSGSASVSITASANKPVWSPAFTISPVKFIESGKNYRATVWARGLHVTGPARLALDWFDASGKRDISWHVGSAQQLISESPSANLKQGDSDWTQLTVSATAPTNAGFVEIDLGSYNNRGTVWFDDVTFE